MDAPRRPRHLRRHHVLHGVRLGPAPTAPAAGHVDVRRRIIQRHAARHLPPPARLRVRRGGHQARARGRDGRVTARNRGCETGRLGGERREKRDEGRVVVDDVGCDAPSRASSTGRRRQRGRVEADPGRRGRCHASRGARAGARRCGGAERGGCQALRAAGRGARAHRRRECRRRGPRARAEVADVRVPRRGDRVPRGEHRVSHPGERHRARQRIRVAFRLRRHRGFDRRELLPRGVLLVHVHAHVALDLPEHHGGGGDRDAARDASG
mmetsp:Transcript_4918/g.20040  ORF Transcript_4918/g.20040 Transcript_4918/m.20040 type:complete len:268 (+) Transcript_4918:382-1185(+)